MPSHDPTLLYFTFPDGALGYRCEGCGACCKGLGVGLDGVRGEPASLAERYPAVRPFLRRTSGAWSARNPTGRCWFLQSDGLCRVEVEHGRDAKPAVCRLFPFNRAFRLGRHLIVDYNSVICPLQRLEDGSGTRHADLAFELGQLEDPALIGVLPCPSNDPDGDHWVARERRIAEACDAATDDVLPSIDAALRAKLPRRVAPAALRAQVADAFQAVFGLPPRLPSPVLWRRAALLTPSMRFNAAFGPRSPLPPQHLPHHLPAMWLAWLHLLAEAEALALEPLSLQQSTGTWVEHQGLLTLLALWSVPVALPPGPIDLPDDPTLRPGLLAIGQALARPGAQPLRDAVLPALPGDPLERVALARAAEVLWGHLLL